MTQAKFYMLTLRKFCKTDGNALWGTNTQDRNSASEQIFKSVQIH